jgi:hypothetical protein
MIGDYQNGFRTNRGTISNIHILRQIIEKTYDLYSDILFVDFNPLNTKLNPICHLLALLGAHPTLHVSRIRVKQDLTLLIGIK